jgi:hypothetical protein
MGNEIKRRCGPWPYPCTEEELLRTGGSNMATGGFAP